MSSTLERREAEQGHHFAKLRGIVYRVLDVLCLRPNLFMLLDFEDSISRSTLKENVRRHRRRRRAL